MKTREDFLTEIAKGLHGQKIFLTGGTGFFGLSLLSFLSNLIVIYKIDLQLTVLSRDPESFLQKNPKYKNLSWLRFVKGDVCNFLFPDEKFQFILHFATPASAALNQEQPQKIYEIIVDGTRHILEFAKKTNARKILFASSGAVYGVQPSNISYLTEEMCRIQSQPTKVQPSYAEGKRTAEALGVQFVKEQSQMEIDFLIARCFAFIGPDLDRNGAFAIGNFIRDSLAGKKITIQSDGRPLRSYLYAEDLIIWLLIILLKGKSTQPYNVGSDQAISILDLATIVKKNLNPNVEIEVQTVVDEKTPVPQYVPSINLARSELGLSVWTSLEEAIQRSV